MNFTSSTGNNNKNNSNAAVPFFAYHKQGFKNILTMKEYVTIEEVEQAYRDCKRRKTSSVGCMEYAQDWLLNNYNLYKELNAMTYETGPSKAFCVTRPKIREVFCAQFRDRVVHHLLMNHFGELFDAEMIPTAYACRKGKGTLCAARTTRRQIEEVSEGYTKEAWILKGDLQGFFMSIGRRKVFDMVEALIREKYTGGNTEWWLWLWKKIILNAPEHNCVRVGDLELWKLLPANKSLFTNGEGMGLPIGNLPSQVLANLLLSPFDRYMLQGLGASGRYGRYVDDFVCVHSDRHLLLDIYTGARVFLEDNLGLTLHPRKFYLQEARKGVTFAGAAIKPGRAYPSRRTVQNLFTLIRKYNISKIDVEKFALRYNSYMGHLRWHNTWRARKRAWQCCKKAGLMNTNYNKITILTKRK